MIFILFAGLVAQDKEKRLRCPSGTERLWRNTRKGTVLEKLKSTSLLYTAATLALLSRAGMRAAVNQTQE
ncbi:hypothetical protein HQN88_35235 [Paenibacillus qinlingensis]|nr:hypothetical protein [Paenibacillus qinlingensis]